MTSNLPSTPSNVKAQQEQDRIKVAVRMRPSNPREIIRRGDQIVIECVDDIGDILVNDRYQSKKYNFDTVFGPGATQKTIFNSVVTPTLDEVLKGYSCTIFAYGQTGTGKTYTMEGDRSDDRALGWEDDPVAGIIPRTVAYFYDRLKNGDYSIRVSYLEIYNENLTDLLCARDGTAEVSLKICANTNGIACVQNLTEHMVRTKDEVFELLARGSMKRRTAETKMNERSSRSHAVFMITLVMQQKSDIGEEVVKTGKLYLVDLAGSENISRSGALEGRAQEAGNINKSLLTLGRVITALVERKPHIPYRDSKLTRLLQDSLGGRNKTTIIATISPALNCLDETLSTLDYAFKAKNILNKPEINQRVSKDVHVKEVYAELEKARRDLEATWAKMGVTLSKETYQNLMDMLEARKEKIQALEVDVQQFQSLYDDSKAQADGFKKELNDLYNLFWSVSKRLENYRKQILEQEKKAAFLDHFADEVVRTGAVNVQRLANTVSVADTAISHLSCLHDRLQVRSKIEEDNAAGFKEVSKNVQEGSQQARVKIGDTKAKQADEITGLRQQLSSKFSESCSKLGTLGKIFQKVVDDMDWSRQWCDQVAEKLRYGDATEKAMAVMGEKFSLMLEASRQEHEQLVVNMEALCREGRAVAEEKRDAAVTTFVNIERESVVLAHNYSGSVISSIEDTVQTVEKCNLEAAKMGEAIKALNASFATIQELCKSLNSQQGALQSRTKQFDSEASSFAHSVTEQSSRIVSQMVEAFYAKLYEISFEVSDHSKSRQQTIENKGNAETSDESSKLKAVGAEMDACLAAELESAKMKANHAAKCSSKGCEDVDDVSNATVSLSEFIDSKLSSEMSVIQHSLEAIDEDVEHVAKLPGEFLTQDLKVYQATGITPKPQSWEFVREPLDVPPKERVLAGFMPPSELFAKAEELEQAEAELLKSAKVPVVRRSSLSENVVASEPVPNLTKAPTVTLRRAFGQKTPVTDDKEN